MINIISKEAIEDRLETLENYYYICLSELIVERLFNNSSKFTKEDLIEYGKEITKIKKYCSNGESKVNFSFEFDEEGGILHYLKVSRDIIHSTVEDIKFKIELNQVNGESINKGEISKLKEELSKRIDEEIKLNKYIRDYKDNYKIDKAMLEKYFIKFNDESVKSKNKVISVMLDIEVDSDFNVIKTEIRR